MNVCAWNNNKPANNCQYERVCVEQQQAGEQLPI